MNANSPTVGLSARQKINGNFGNFFWLFLALLILFLASSVSTSGQVRGLKKAPPKNSNEPKVDIKVNRHYDNKGNIIGYDSTYSSYYSSTQDDTIGMHNMMKSLSRHFSDMRGSFFDKHFDKLFFTDSVLAPGFLRKDSFNHDFFLNHDSWYNFFDDMTNQRDSIKSGFFKWGHKRRYKL